MMAGSRASQALLFMQHCRQSSALRPKPFATRQSSSASPYAPSNFTGRRASPGANPESPSAAASSPPSFESAARSSPRASRSPFPSSRPSYAHPVARQPRPTELAGTRLTFRSWFLSMFGVAPKPASNYVPAPFRVQNNPYRARKQWPPDFDNLDPKQQFHFEKTYRRRTALKWARPAWNKSIKILQHTLITATIIYFVFFLEPANGQGTPFDGFRIWFFEKLGKLGQLPDSTREEADRLRDEAKSKMKPRVDTASSKAAS